MTKVSIDEIVTILNAGLDDDYGIPYNMYKLLYDILYNLYPKLAQEYDAKVRSQDGRVYIKDID